MRREDARLHLLALKAIAASRFRDGFTSGYDRLIDVVGDGAEEVPRDAFVEVKNHVGKLCGPLLSRLEKGLAARNRDALAALVYLSGERFDSYEEALAWVRARGSAITGVVRGPF